MTSNKLDFKINNLNKGYLKTKKKTIHHKFVTFERSYIKFDQHIRLRESTQVILTPYFQPK